MKLRLLYLFSFISFTLFTTGIVSAQQSNVNTEELSNSLAINSSPTDNKSTVFTIGTGTYLLTEAPVNARRRYSFSQTLYLKSELTFGNKAISQIAYRYGGNKPSLPLNIEVWIGHTALTQLSATVQLTNSVKVYDGPWLLATGQAYTPIEIDPFIYNNVDNLLITVLEKDQSSGSTTDKFYSTAVPSGKKYCFGTYAGTWPYDPTNLPASTNIAYRANIWLWVDGLPVGPAVSEITPSTLDFGQVETGEYKNLKLQVKNIGAEPMTITGFSSTNPNFSVANISFPLTLTMLQQKFIDIKYESIDPGIENGVVTFLMDPLIAGTKDVQVSAESVVPLVISDFPYFEGFNGGLPAGWKNREIEGDGWFFPSLPYPYAFSFYVNDKERKSMMITPQFDLTGVVSATLALNHRVYGYDIGWYDRILMSTDKINWTIVQEYTVGWDPDGYRYEEFDITPAKSGGKFFLAFEINYPMLLPHIYEAVWEIDDITVTVVMPKYNVSFVVEDEAGVAMNDAIVTLNGITNPAGDYLFPEIGPGVYDYTIENYGYVTASGQATVVDQDVEETVVLHPLGQFVFLNQGWSLISSYQMPENPQLENIFWEQLQDNTMTIMLGKTGIFWPGQNINTIGQWDSYQGQKVKMSADDLAIFKGTMVENKTVNLLQGVSFLPVLSKTNVVASTIFNQIEGKMQFAFDLSDGLIYWPDGGIFTLETLEPGKAYLVSMISSGAVTFEDSDGGSGYETPQPTLIKNAPWQVTKTGSAHIISIEATALEGVLETGDILAVFNSSNVCVGMAQFNGESKNLGLVAYGNDFTSNAIDGMFENEVMNFKLFKASSQTEMEIYPDWDLAMPQAGTFADNGLSKITSFKFGTLGVAGQTQNSLSVFPNPAKGEIFITIPGNEPAQVEIIDQLGQVKLNHNFGRNENSLDISNLKTGIYLLRVTDKNKLTYFTKLVVK